MNVKILAFDWLKIPGITTCDVWSRTSCLFAGVLEERKALIIEYN